MAKKTVKKKTKEKEYVDIELTLPMGIIADLQRIAQKAERSPNDVAVVLLALEMDKHNRSNK